MSSSSVKRRRSPGIEVDSAAVRRARQAAGLSLAEMAEGSVSRQAFHLIETGRSRPSIDVLRHIAQRTGRKVSDFYARGFSPKPTTTLQSESVVELERLVRIRDFTSATDLGVHLLETLDGSSEDANIRLLLGEALVMSRNPEPALTYLRAARQRFDEALDVWGSVDAMDWEGMALYLLDDPASLQVLRESLDRCQELRPIFDPTYIRILAHVATVHVSRHEWREAIRYYQQAAQASERLRDLAQVARSYDGLSQAYGRLGQTARAISFANKALALYGMQSDLAGVFRAENNLGDLLLQIGEVDSAEPHLRHALEGFRMAGIDRRGTGYVLVNLADLTFRRGDPDGARDLVAEATRLADELGEVIVKANAELLLARIATAANEYPAARRHYEIAIGILRRQKMPQRLREAHLAFGRLLREEGQIARAADQFELAAVAAKEGTELEIDEVALGVASL
jgi:tetratricopeptide (TPR) repeat protein/DNA-binding XRE family transcriptional regulator